MKFKHQLFLAIATLAIMSCNTKNEIKVLVSNAVDAIYFGGDIITMEGDSANYAEAVAVKDGKIVFVGSKVEAEKMKSDSTVMTDLQGKTLLPGFIDAHSHFSSVASKLNMVGLDPPPAGDIQSIEDMIIKLKMELSDHPEKYKTEKDWLFGNGFDNGMLKENRFPTSADLDQISTTIPIALTHFSGHMLVLNTKAMERAGYFAKNYKAPEGGSLQYFQGTKNPNGVIEEQAMLTAFSRIGEDMTGVKEVYTTIPLDDTLMKSKLLEAQELYLSKGYTTILDAVGSEVLYKQLSDLGSQNKLNADVGMLYYGLTTPIDFIKNAYSTTYNNHLRVMGVKLNLDGGTPGRTAFLREPYYTPTPNQPATYRGYSSIADQEKLNTLVASFYQSQVPAFIHAIGDAALDQCIEAVTYAEKTFKYSDARTQLIHLQIVNPDQYDSLQKLDVTITFQITHNFYFSDYHAINTLGPERTARLNPIKDAFDRKISTTIHHDASVHPVDQMMIIWIAVNRLSRSGKVYGKDQCITPYQALQASTIYPAFQFREEKSKGTLTTGKLADFVVLEKNPLKVDPKAIKDIKVMETIKEGKSVFKKLNN